MDRVVIETERLILRLPLPSDRAALHAMWADPRVMADLGRAKTPEDSDATLARHDSYRHEGLGFWVVERRVDRAIAGFCGLKRGAEATPIAGAVEAGWMLAVPYWGMGYAHEAMVASLAWGWAHKDAARIVAITAARNVKSQKLMARLGMMREADMEFDHPAFAVGDPLRPTVTYAIDRPA
ncbi:GNAT family N-acetyltransferase [Sphingomonas sp. PB4P5]|uniref:GNAT family N-acetyltransferase n=1 Tax=Parasphingomonas puruogangriensis TaxID=3096155 RepID=UPI002FC88D5F